MPTAMEFQQNSLFYEKWKQKLPQETDSLYRYNISNMSLDTPT